MEYKNPASTVDIIVEQSGSILLIRRGIEPFKGFWALPGGFLNYGQETLENAAKRELKEETRLIALGLKLFRVYSDPKRDPRGHVISHTYIANVKGEIKAGDDAKEARYFPLDKLPELAFDHKNIIRDYCENKNV